MIRTNLSLLGSFAIGILICVSSGCQEPTQIDCQIVGHSMAPVYKSEHSVATCDQCGFEFACDVVEGDNKGSTAVICGNCGCEIGSKPVAQSADLAVLIPDQSIRRWDVVAIRLRDRVLVKRVLGLPGDKINFNAGNLEIDDVVVKTPQGLWNELSTVVFDSQPSSSQANSTKVFERLVPRAKDAWNFTGTSIVHHSGPVSDDDQADSDFDFLDYRHRRCYKNSDDPKTPVAIDDAHPFNQSIRRLPHPVDELDVRVEAVFAEKGSIRIERQTRRGAISATLELLDDLTIDLKLTYPTGEDIKTVKERGIKLHGRTANVSLVNYDNQIRLFIQGKERVKPIQLEPIGNSDRFEVDTNKSPVSIGVSRDDTVTLERVSIWRDWHLYQDEPKLTVKLPLYMGKQAYYVVGDNLPVSEDSRHFGRVYDVIGVVQPFVGEIDE